MCTKSIYVTDTNNTVAFNIGNPGLAVRLQDTYKTQE